MLDKSSVLRALTNELAKKISMIQFDLDDLKSALESDTKSSAGDKHETSRAMTQLELEKLSGQLDNIHTYSSALSLIDPLDNHEIIKYGSLVKTNHGIFFFSIGLGKIDVGNDSVFCLTPVAPIGKMLLGKRKSDTVIFNSNTYVILEVE